MDGIKQLKPYAPFYVLFNRTLFRQTYGKSQKGK